MHVHTVAVTDCRSWYKRTVVAIADLNCCRLLVDIATLATVAAPACTGLAACTRLVSQTTEFLLPGWLGQTVRQATGSHWHGWGCADKNLPSHLPATTTTLPPLDFFVYSARASQSLSRKHILATLRQFHACRGVVWRTGGFLPLMPLPPGTTVGVGLLARFRYSLRGQRQPIS